MTEAIVSLVAQEKLQEVEILVQKLSIAEGELEKGYAHLAFLLRDVSEKRYWLGQHKSFGDFLNYLSVTFNLGKSQLYSYLSTARELGDSVTETQLNEMGINKAKTLRDAKSQSGSIPLNVIEAATRPEVTVKGLKKMLFDAGTITEPQDGVWCDLDFSCYLSEDEKAEVLDAANAARHIDPPVDEKQKDFLQRKEILLRFAKEFLAAYADQVIEGGRGL